MGVEKGGKESGPIQGPSRVGGVCAADEGRSGPGALAHSLEWAPGPLGQEGTWMGFSPWHDGTS